MQLIYPGLTQFWKHITVVFIKKGNFNFKTGHFNAETQNVRVSRECSIKREGTKSAVKNKASFASMQTAAISLNLNRWQVCSHDNTSYVSVQTVKGIRICCLKIWYLGILNILNWGNVRNAHSGRTCFPFSPEAGGKALLWEAGSLHSGGSTASLKTERLTAIQ